LQIPRVDAAPFVAALSLAVRRIAANGGLFCAREKLGARPGFSPARLGVRRLVPPPRTGVFA